MSKNFEIGLKEQSSIFGNTHRSNQLKIRFYRFVFSIENLNKFRKKNPSFFEQKKSFFFTVLIGLHDHSELTVTTDLRVLCKFNLIVSCSSLLPFQNIFFSFYTKSVLNHNYSHFSLIRNFVFFAHNIFVLILIQSLWPDGRSF